MWKLAMRVSELNSYWEGWISSKWWNWRSSWCWDPRWKSQGWPSSPARTYTRTSLSTLSFPCKQQNIRYSSSTQQLHPDKNRLKRHWMILERLKKLMKQLLLLVLLMKPLAMLNISSRDCTELKFISSEVGRVQRKLEKFGGSERAWVWSIWKGLKRRECAWAYQGGCSKPFFAKGLIYLASILCNARWRLRTVGLQRGRLCDKGELGVLLGRVRKQLSVAVWETGPDQQGRGDEMSWSTQ